MPSEPRVSDSMDPASVAKADQSVDLLYQIGAILDTGLDKEAIRILVGLCEAGVNPEALATVVKELRREAAALAAAERKPPSSSA